MKRKLSKIYTRYSYLFIVLSFIFFPQICSSAAEDIYSSPAHPVKIIDGDSLEIGSLRIRLTGIDAPEYDQFCKNAQNKNYPCGKEADKYLRQLIKDQQLFCKTHQKDRYNRNLCTCYVQDLDINAEMVRSGNAVAYMESPYSKEQEEAKLHKRGIWQGKFMQPRLFRRLKELQKPK